MIQPLQLLLPYYNKLNQKQIHCIGAWGIYILREIGKNNWIAIQTFSLCGLIAATGTSSEELAQTLAEMESGMLLKGYPTYD